MGSCSAKMFKGSFPSKNENFRELCRRLKSTGVRLEAVLEPSGTYSTAIRSLFNDIGLPTYQVQGKRVKDAREVFDGVPSSHDAKSAAILVWLHAQGISRPWPFDSVRKRALGALSKTAERHAKLLRRRQGHLEARMALHWPRYFDIIGVETSSALRLLSVFGSPDNVARNPHQARQLLLRVSRHKLSKAKIDALLESAADHHGLPMISEEAQLVMALASEAVEARERHHAARKKVEQRSKNEVPETFRKMVGGYTAGALVGMGLDPAESESPNSYINALGLNLRETSSGTVNGRVHITKRGNPEARRLLHFVAMRHIKEDPIVRAWFSRWKRRSPGNQGMKGVTAVVRKLAKALWHVARGEPFDAQLLYNAKHLASDITH